VSQTQFGQGVIRGFFVRLLADDFFEGLGYRIAMLRHVANLTVRQPKFEQQIQG
jgi:hypothetical protein